jgi:hypothetical protein
MWRDIRREGIVVHGRRIDELVELHDGETGANQERERCPGTQLSVQGRGVPGRG